MPTLFEAVQQQETVERSPERGSYKVEPGCGCENARVTSPPAIPNVLAQRYASAPMVELWSPEQRVRLERDLWIALLRAQSDLGIPVPDGTIEAYEAVARPGRSRVHRGS